MTSDLDPLISHLTATSGLSAGQARRVIDDVLAYLDETVDVFVSRRHRELMHEGLRNDAIYAQLATELRERRFAAPPVTKRQIRRMVYG